jgi:hypothetical protein
VNVFLPQARCANFVIFEEFRQNLSDASEKNWTDDTGVRFDTIGPGGQVMFDSDLPCLRALAKIRPTVVANFRIPDALRSKLSIDDVLQEIARTVIRASLNVEYTQDDWDNAILAIAIRQFRKQIAIASKDRAETEGAIEVPVESETQEIEILDFLSTCTPRLRRLILYRMEGRSYREIGNLENLNSVTVKRLLGRIGPLLELTDE